MTYFFRMSVGACACTAIRVLFLYWATHNVLSSILPFIMNAASPFKCSHKHTADKNLIKCRLKPNRKTHWLIIFYHIPWSYFFPLHTFDLFFLGLHLFCLPKVAKHLTHLTVAPWDCVKCKTRGGHTINQNPCVWRGWKLAEDGGVYMGARKELVASSQICIIFQRTIPAL